MKRTNYKTNSKSFLHDRPDERLNSLVTYCTVDLIKIRLATVDSSKVKTNGLEVPSDVFRFDKLISFFQN